MTPGRAALQVLNELSPAFHPDPKMVDGALEDQFVAGPREMAGAAGASYAIGNPVLQYLADLPASGWTSVESGCGYSTVVLAGAFGSHFCVNPDLSSNRLVGEFVDRHLGTTGLRFVGQSSDQGLPGLAAEALRVDLALIDGNHSHPFPLLDFHYMDQMLSVGGQLLVDNVEIGAVQELIDYLEVEPAYRLERLIGNCAVYQKVGTRAFGWRSQTIRRPPSDVEVARRELTLLRMEVTPELRAALSGAYQLPAAGEVDSGVDNGDQPLPNSSRSEPGTGPSRFKVARVVRWYLAPSGLLLAAALLLIAAGFVTEGAWRLVGVLGVLLLGLFMPYRLMREQRRSDEQTRRTIEREVRPAQIRRSVAGLGADLKEKLAAVNGAADVVDRSIWEIRTDLRELHLSEVELRDRVDQLDNRTGGVEASLRKLTSESRGLSRGGRAGGLRSRNPGNSPELQHEDALSNLLHAVSEDESLSDTPGSG